MPSSLRGGAPRRAPALLLLGALASSGCEQRYWVCDDVDQGLVARVPERLSETGLYVDIQGEVLGAGVLAYRPQHELWSDGADKRRWLWLPPGAVIDTGDPDDWIFPEGTKFWKEFTRDGVRVETRLFTKLGPSEGDWLGVAYVWDEGAEAWLTPYGAMDARGTPHDVPASNECMACHGGTKSRVLGFSALQLAPPAREGELDLSAVQDLGLVTEPLPAPPSIPGNDVERAALGYLHANCGHCHSRERPENPGSRCYDPDNDLHLRLSVRELSSVANTATVRTMAGVIVPGYPERSRLIEFMSNRGLFGAMPPLASELVDTEAVETVGRFIEGLR